MAALQSWTLLYSDVGTQAWPLDKSINVKLWMEDDETDWCDLSPCLDDWAYEITQQQKYKFNLSVFKFGSYFLLKWVWGLCVVSASSL